MKQVEDILALAPLQELMLAQRAGGPRLAIIGRTVSLLDYRTARCRIVQESVGIGRPRHAILRTAQPGRDLKSLCKLYDAPLTYPGRNWIGARCRPEDRASRRDAFLAEGRRRGFELAKPPLMRLQLARHLLKRAGVVFCLDMPSFRT